MISNTRTEGVVDGIKSKLSDYAALVKLKLSFLVVFSAVIAYIITVGTVDIAAVCTLALGGFLITGAANALNQVLEKDTDKLMNRTANRPLPTGRMKISEAVLSAGLMSVAGLALLASFNPLTALLGSLSLLSYAFIYTPMKKVSPKAVLIGAFPGAFPVLIGSVAATGTLTPLALALFAIQFLWQFPHFWAIAWVAYEDYAKAGFFLLPNENKDGRDVNTGLQCLVYSLLMIPVGLIPFYLGATGIISAIITSLAGIWFSYLAYRLMKECTDQAAKKLMFGSFIYLPVVFVALLLDVV